jgi:glycosyltransferase involved in cell wall biosynthesis
LPVQGYSGIEREVQYLAEAFYRRGHEVKLYCSVAGNVDTVKYPWMQDAQDLVNENDAITYIDDLKKADVVHDFSHSKPLRMAKLKYYLATVMWTDAPTFRSVYPSRAVAAAFSDPTGAVVPLGLPVDTLPTVAGGDGYYIAAGRIAPYKGTDIAVGIAKSNGVKLCVAGHTGKFADTFFSMVIQKLCKLNGYNFVGNPSDDELMALIRSAKGLIHMHRWIESFSLVAAQALCLGVPVLTSNVGAPQEYVSEIGGGVVSPLPPEGADTTPEADKFVSTEYTLAERQEIASKARALFDINRIADIYLNIYSGGKA